MLNFKQRKKHKVLIFLKVISVFFIITLLSVFFVFNVNAATQWVDDPGLCSVMDATSFPGQNCAPTSICGDDTGIAQCYDTSALLPPAITAASNVSYSASYPNGGYILNCYATVDAAAPFCDNNSNYWCNRNNTCYSTQHRETVCTADAWGDASCGSCRAGFEDCDTGADACEIQFGVTNYPTGANNNYLNCTTAQCDSGWSDCDASGIDVGNGCEIQEGAVCTVGALTGSWNACTCLVDKQYFETGTEAAYSTTDPLLWGVQHGAGDLIHFGNGTDPDLFIVNNDGAVQLGQIVAPGTTTDRLYNVAGDLYWNGVAIGAGAGGDSLYSADGSLAGNRAVNFNNFNLDYNVTDGNYYGVNIGDGSSVYLGGSLGIGNPMTDLSIELTASSGWQGGSVMGSNNNNSAQYEVYADGLEQFVSFGAFDGTALSGDVKLTETGFSYDDDYAARNTTNDRWLVDKAYVDSVAGSGGGSVSTITLSTVTTNGSFSSGGFIGYEAGNDICNAEFPGSYFCRTYDVIRYIDEHSAAGLAGTAWIAEGPPGYTSNSNDCNGWTDSVDTKLGAFWEFSTNGGGMGWLTTCAVSKQLACCE